MCDISAHREAVGVIPIFAGIRYQHRTKTVPILTKLERVGALMGRSYATMATEFRQSWERVAKVGTELGSYWGNFRAHR